RKASRSPEDVGSTVTPDFRSVSNWGGSKSRVSSLSIAFRGFGGEMRVRLPSIRWMESHSRVGINRFLSLAES
ncbi:MAG: hypothetical protein VX739_09920, partial [Planctomycetota bacterium]|nr:hypothetical protein [Planctomycetota bacterium]